MRRRVPGTSGSLARSIAVHVQRLASGLSPCAGFKVALAMVAAHWSALAKDPSPQHLPDGDRQLWQPAPVSLQ